MQRRNEVLRQRLTNASASRRGLQLMARAVGSLALFVGCHHDVTVLSPDLSQSQLYRLQLVNNQSPPYLVETVAFGGTKWLSDAQLVPVDLGRGNDPRIFEDRSGSGTSGGTVRDSSAVSGRVADVRIFQERDRFDVLLATVRDSVVVNVIRHGDTLFVQRESINPTLAYTDTAIFADQNLVMRVRRWFHAPSAVPLLQAATITYSVTAVTVAR